MSLVRYEKRHKQFLQSCRYLIAPEDSLMSSEPGYRHGAERWRGLAFVKCVFWWGIAVVVPLALFAR